ncbi:hypothetical protein [Thiohalobacter sp. COW1]|nr:hypothetical protein [Thiohalobacter sp. COW1]
MTLETLIKPHPSFRRRPESIDRCGIWIPACAGMTDLFNGDGSGLAWFC